MEYMITQCCNSSTSIHVYFSYENYEYQLSFLVWLEDNGDWDWKKSNRGAGPSPGPIERLVALGDSDNRGSYTELRFFGCTIDRGGRSFSKDLDWGSIIPNDRIGPPKRSACWSMLILLDLYVYLKYFSARTGPIPVATISWSRNPTLALIIEKYHAILCELWERWVELSILYASLFG